MQRLQHLHSFPKMPVIVGQIYFITENLAFLVVVVVVIIIVRIDLWKRNNMLMKATCNTPLLSLKWSIKRQTIRQTCHALSSIELAEVK